MAARGRAPAPVLRGAVRIVGGPGSGKSTLLASLHRSLVADGVAADRILVLVRSAGARDDLHRRLAAGGPAAQPLPVVRTAPEAARWVLGVVAGGGPEPLVLTGFGTWLAARAALGRARSQLPRLGALHDDPACIEDVRRAVAACRQAMVGPGLLAQRLTGAAPALQELAVLAARGEDVRRAASATDLDGVVGDAVLRLLGAAPGIGGRYDALLVDDAQEWDVAQFHLVCALARALPDPLRLAVAGDPGQAIRGGLGGSARWFQEELPLALAVEDWALPGSWRCPTAVLAAAAALDPTAPPLEPGPGEVAGPPAVAAPAVEIWRAVDETDEAVGVVRAIKAWVLGGGGRYRDAVVLLRTLGQLGPVFAEAFEQVGVPCLLGRAGWSRHPAVGSLRGWLRWSADPADATLLAAVLEAPWGGLSSPARRWLRDRSSAHGFDLRRTLRAERRRRTGPDPGPGGAEGAPHQLELGELEGRLDRAEAWADPLRRGPADPGALLVWVGQVALAVGLFAAAAEDPGLAQVLRSVDESLRAILDVEVRLRGRPPTLAVALDLLEVALGRATDDDEAADPDRDAVPLLTIQQARGLGFRRVFVCGCASGMLPATSRPLGLLAPDELTLLLERVPELQDTVQDPERQLEEEARQLVVALTRAEALVTCTYAQRYGGRPAEPSVLLAPLRAAGVPERALPDIADVTRADIVAGMAAAVLQDGGSVPIDLAGAEPPVAELAETLSAFDPVEGRPADLPLPVELATTAVGEWLACPRRLFYHLVLRPGPPGIRQLRGQAAHRLLELVHRDEVRWLGDPSAFLRVAEEHLERSVLPWLASRVPSRLAHRALAAWLRRLAVRYAHHVVGAPGADQPTLGVEAPFRLQLDGIVVRGRIDRLRRVAEGAVEVVDYKTGRDVPSRSAIVPAVFGSAAAGPTDWQLPVYGLALSRGTVAPLRATVPALLRAWYVGVTPAHVRDPGRPIHRRGLRIDGSLELAGPESAELGELTPADLAGFADRLEREGRRIAGGRFPAQPRHAVRTCLDQRRGCQRSGCCAGAGSVGGGHPVERP